MSCDYPRISCKWEAYCVGFCVWFLWFSMFFRLIHVVVYIQNMFLFIAEEYPIGWIGPKMFLLMGFRDYFWLGAVMSKAAMNFCVCLWEGREMFSFLWWKCLGTNELFGKCLIKVIRSCQTVVQRSCAMLRCHHPSMRVVTDTHPHQYMVLSVFLILTVPNV